MECFFSSEYVKTLHFCGDVMKYMWQSNPSNPCLLVHLISLNPFLTNALLWLFDTIHSPANSWCCLPVIRGWHHQMVCSVFWTGGRCTLHLQQSLMRKSWPTIAAMFSVIFSAIPHCFSVSLSVTKPPYRSKMNLEDVDTPALFNLGSPGCLRNRWMPQGGKLALLQV